ncbi:MAG: glutathione peroxidase [Rhodobacteraceae bacterium]|jgi:glutathione peroxidase|nr:glutathione peroxidase [Paracoccaceae bacterium]
MRAVAAFAAATFAPLLLAAAIVAIALARPAPAAGRSEFDSIDAGTLAMDDRRACPAPVVNTASLCAFPRQHASPQALHDRHAGRGLAVPAVPSGDVAQGMGGSAAVRGFCTVTWGLALPMAAVTRVRGPGAHPFLRRFAAARGVGPAWNLGKVPIGRDGGLVAGRESLARPSVSAITAATGPRLAR